MLRRERKRRARGRAWHSATAAAASLPSSRPVEATIISGYLPAELDDAELARNRGAGASSGPASRSPKDLGAVMRAPRWPTSPAGLTASASSEQVRAALVRRLVRRAVELVQRPRGRLWRANMTRCSGRWSERPGCSGLPARQPADARRRAGRAPNRRPGDRRARLALAPSGHPPLDEATLAAVDRGAARRPAPPAEGARRRRLASPRHARRASDSGAEALRRLDREEHRHVRDRPGRHGEDLPGRRTGRGGAPAARRSTGSSSPGRPSRPASGSASCRGTLWKRSTPTCGRCSTRCTT